MKKILKILILSSLIITMIVIVSCNKDDNSPVVAASCLPTNLQNGVIAAYTFGNGTLNDSSGNGYHLTNTTTASPGADRAGNPNCAFHFTQANDEFIKHVNPSFLDNIQSQPFSISLWYKNEKTSIGEFEQLIGRDTVRNCPGIMGQWSLSLFDFRKPNFGMNGYNTNWNSNPINSVSITSSQWRHLVVTSDGNLDYKLYLNGVVSSTPLNPSITPCNIPTINGGELFLGMLFDGFLDDIIIYNRTLTQAEINQLNNLPACCM